MLRATEKYWEVVSDEKRHVNHGNDPLSPSPRGAQSSPGASAEPSCPALRGKRAASWSALAAGGTGQGLGPVTELQFPGETRDPAR